MPQWKVTLDYQGSPNRGRIARLSVTITNPTETKTKQGALTFTDPKWRWKWHEWHYRSDNCARQIQLGVGGPIVRAGTRFVQPNYTTTSDDLDIVLDKLLDRLCRKYNGIAEIE